VYVVDRVADGLEVFEVLVIDPEVGDPARERLLEGLDEFNQGKGVSFEVVDEGLALTDSGGIDLKNVGEAVADDLEDLVAGDRGTAVVGHASIIGRGDPRPQSSGPTARPISPTTSASTISRATETALVIARALDEPWEMMQTPSVPRSMAPP
jgi:hypothetical protein